MQTMEAGTMEIADIFVVNKTDHAGAARTAGEIHVMLALQDVTKGVWRPPVPKTRAAAEEIVGRTR